ncbi:MAG: DUF6515 family protein [Smithella sp.]
MKKIKKVIKRIVLMIMLVVFSGIMLLGCPQPVSAKMQGGSSHGRSSFSHGGSSYSHGRYAGGYRGGWYGGYRGWSGGYRGWYYGGWWYPWALTIPFLPFYYSTIWIADYPYYYADGNYYAPTDGGYMVVDPPQDAIGKTSPSVSSAPPAPKLFIYPRNGQSEKQQADDRYQCHRWAVGQTDYDPTTVSGAPSVQKNADYQRAMGACLDARGYTVR